MYVVKPVEWCLCTYHVRIVSVESVKFRQSAINFQQSPNNWEDCRNDIEGETAAISQRRQRRHSSLARVIFETG